MTCTAVHVTPNPNPNHVLSGTAAAVSEPGPGIWDLNTKLVLSEHHATLLESCPCYTIFPASGATFYGFASIDCWLCRSPGGSLKVMR
jgi:hypothetical protein